MHEIIFYRDKRGKEPVYDYLKDLQKDNSKDGRIRFNKANDYIQALSCYCTNLGDNYFKHLDGDIWELRPVGDRILFAAWVNGSFVLLHHFKKKTQKTPRREIEKAKRELEDFIERSSYE